MQANTDAQNCYKICNVYRSISNNEAFRKSDFLLSRLHAWYIDASAPCTLERQAAALTCADGA